MLPSFPLAVLVLADGTVFHGLSIGASGLRTGELVFNTGMTGYQEIITDTSYANQIIVFSYPHIGNTGVNQEDLESESIYASGIIIRNPPINQNLHYAANFRMQRHLTEYLCATNMVALAGIDTRKLINILREKGTQIGCIYASQTLATELTINQVKDITNTALINARNYDNGGLSGVDLAQIVSTKKPYIWEKSIWLGQNQAKSLTKFNTEFSAKSSTKSIAKYNVVVFDFGVKHNILRMFVSRFCKVTVVPAKTTAKEIVAYKPDGVFLSNGPADPRPCAYAISVAQTLMKLKIPMFGICLGHQIMALASGMSIIKMKFGHHGINHPIKDLSNGRVMISSQNHNFVVDNKNLNEVQITHISLFDHSIQGLTWKNCPAFSFQGHPEASPGPNDMSYLFDQFLSLMQPYKG